jgi:hypothetical protein
LEVLEIEVKMICPGTKEFLLSASRVAADYVLTVVWGTVALAALLALTSVGYSTAREGMLGGALGIIYRLIVIGGGLSFSTLLCGILLFAIAWVLHRCRAPMLASGIVCALVSGVMAVSLFYRSLPVFALLLTTVRSVFLLFCTVIVAPTLSGLYFGFLILPRRMRQESVRPRVVHWAVILAPLVLLSRSTQLDGQGGRVGPEPELVYCRWEPGTGTLVVHPFIMSAPNLRGIPGAPALPSIQGNLSSAESERLRTAGVGGEITIVGMAKPNPSEGRIILVMQHQLDEPFEFSKPAGNTDVIYLQGLSGWQKLPSDAVESNQKLRLMIPKDKPQHTCIANRASAEKSTECGSAFYWVK